MVLEAKSPSVWPLVRAFWLHHKMDGITGKNACKRGHAVREESGEGAGLLF
jgi:hypothetical protein